ncbi:unnamed protein product [Chrysoparadoxa australica]
MKRSRAAAAFLLGSVLRSALAGNPSSLQAQHPYRHLAQVLQQHRSESDDANHSDKAYRRGITLLSSSQKTLKNFDGLVHEVGGRVRGDGSTDSLEELLLELTQEEKRGESSKSKVKEAKKMIGLRTKVGMALEAAELAEIGSCLDEAEAAAMAEAAGLEPLPLMVLHTVVKARNATAAVEAGNELVSPGASTNTSAQSSQCNDAVEDELKEVEYREEGFMKQVLLDIDGGQVICRALLDRKKQRVVITVGDTLDAVALLTHLQLEAEPVQLVSHGLLQEALYMNPSALEAALDALKQLVSHLTNFLSSEKGDKFAVHCVGHSLGGAVAAVMAGTLEGTLAVDSASGSSEEDEEEVEGDEGACSMTLPSEVKVSCVTLGCPPCISRGINMPFVTSFVLGDDMVPRCSHTSLARLKQRLNPLIKSGGFLGRGLAMGTTMLTDVAGVAVQGVKQHGTGGAEEELTVPGRVWFVKPRRLHGGATMVQVMRGNLREDMLWQLHEILLSKSMLQHHTLHNYITTLDRV